MGSLCPQEPPGDPSLRKRQSVGAQASDGGQGPKERLWEDGRCGLGRLRGSGHMAGNWGPVQGPEQTGSGKRQAAQGSRTFQTFCTSVNLGLDRSTAVSCTLREL